MPAEIVGGAIRHPSSASAAVKMRTSLASLPTRDLTRAAAAAAAAAVFVALCQCVRLVLPCRACSSVLGSGVK